MPGERIVLDGLWRCLCPSVDPVSLMGALQAPFVRLRPPPIHRSIAKLHAPHRQHVRAYGTLLSQDSNVISSDTRKEKRGLRTVDGVSQGHSHYLRRAWKRNPELPPSLFGGPVSFDEAHQSIDTKAIIDTLKEFVTMEGQYHAICELVQYLVINRQTKPDAFLYECLIRANIDPQHGSARVVADLLKEMEKIGCLPTNAIYHAVLDVLAIHPDYVLRNNIINDMKQAWLTPTFDGSVSIAVGLLRDGQFEMALEKLEELHKTGVPIPSWLHEIFIFTFGETGIHEETLMILQHRLNQATTVLPPTIWSFLLDVFSRDAFYEGIKYVWDRAVTSGLYCPSDAVVLGILNAASQNGDVALAMESVKTLSNRGRKLGMHHFEPLLEVHTGAGDFRKAFFMMCLMTKAGLQPDLSSTRAIYRKLQSSPAHVEEALTALRDLKQDHQVPIAAFNVIIEATLFHTGFKSGLELYRSLPQVCNSPPDVDTFNLLLGRCTLHKSMRFLLAEMEAFSIKPDETTYNSAILISTLNPNYEPAFRYLEKMKASQLDGQSNGWWMKRATALALIRRCIFAEDSRVQELLAECKERGINNIEEDVRLFITEVQRKREEKLASTSVSDAGADSVVVTQVPELMPG